MSTTWHARIDWASPTPITDDTALELLENLATHAPSGSIARDGLTGSVAVAVEAESLDEAVGVALDAVRDALLQRTPSAAVDGLEIITAAAMDRELDRPIFPEVVGYAEIAELAGVSRQRARAFRQVPGFPEPVIETAQGPLMAKAAVEQWVETRNTRPGPRTA